MPIKQMTPEVLVALSAAPTTPAPTAGEMYFDTTIGRVGWYSGSAWVYPATPGVIPTASSAPSGYVAGRMYYDTTLNAVGVYNGSAFQYIPMGVTSTTSAITAAVSGTTGAVALTFNPSNVTLDLFGQPQSVLNFNTQQVRNLVLEDSSGAPTANLTQGRVYYDPAQGSIGLYAGTGWQYFPTVSTQATPPYASIYATSAAATLGTGFAQLIWAHGVSFSGVTYSASTGLLTVSVAGNYMVSGQITTGNSGGSTYCQMGVYHNGSLALTGSRGNSTSANDSASNVTGWIACAAGDTLAPGGRCTTASTALDTTTFPNGVSNYFQIQYLSRQ
jgi:hypothetical protein